MKHLYQTLSIATLSTCIGLSAHATTSKHPIYVGAGFGYSAQNTPSGEVFTVGSASGSTVNSQTDSTSTTGGFGGIGLVGIMLNENFAIEADYVSYAESEYKSTQSQFDTSSQTTVGTNTASIDYTTQSFGLFIKGIKPISKCLSISAKLGADYVMQEVDYSNPTGTPTIGVDNSKLATPKEGNHTYDKIMPAGGISLIGHVNEHLFTSVFFEGFLGDSDSDLKNDQDAIASAYITGISLNYMF